ncbi:MAG: acyl carrier protein [Acidimicrobiia bacterium]|nr:acyl carrier protein [Acidimicrobiia bacterium]
MDDALSRIVADVFDIDSSELSDEVDFPSLDGWDSLNHMEFITRVEETFEVELTGDEIADMRSIALTRKILAAKTTP